MIRCRMWCSALAAWYFVFFNVERLYAPLNLASFVYVLAAAAGLIVILLPTAARLRWPMLLAALLGALLVGKWMLGYPIGHLALPLTVTEYCALVLSGLLAQRVASCFDEFENAVYQCMTGHLDNRSTTFEHGQAELYREVRRARFFERPLTVLAVKPNAQDLTSAQNRLISDVAERLSRNYVTARIADLLSRLLKDCDVIAQRDRHFLVVLPETTPDQAKSVAKKLHSAAKRNLGFELRIGMSAFPSEEKTLVELLQRAEQRMRQVVLDAGEESKPSQALPATTLAASLHDTPASEMRDTAVEGHRLPQAASAATNPR
jgi:hypothetical protein